MKLIKQINISTCGQACIAMIANKTIKTVIHDFKTDGPTSINQLNWTLLLNGNIMILNSD